MNKLINNIRYIITLNYLVIRFVQYTCFKKISIVLNKSYYNNCCELCQLIITIIVIFSTSNCYKKNEKLQNKNVKWLD